MSGVMLLKFCQHESALKVLADTGESPLLYTQIPTGAQARNDQILNTVAAKVFGADKTKQSNFGSLLHPDDGFWGVEPILDPKGHAGNNL